MADHPRDASIERILRQRTGAGPASPSAGTCVDGETLAAWTAGALQSAEAATVEHHLADCARCQAMIVAFVRSEPAVAPAAAWWQRWQVRWLVPVATAATVAAIYVATPDRDVVVRDYVEAPTETTRQQSPTMQAAPDLQARARTQRDAPAKDAEKRAQFKDAPQSAARDEAKSERLAARDPAGAARGTGGTGAAAAPAPAAPTPPSTPVTPVGAPAAPAAPATPVTPAGAPAAPPPPSPGRTAAVDAVQERATVAKDALMAQANRATVEITSPDTTVRWRIAGGRRVERSTDGGTRWDPTMLPGPVMLTAGHSPSAAVLWLVGPAGAIYVTDDGVQFERIPFLDGSDLASVIAADGSQATVTTTDGRRFHTRDRGATWSRP